MVLYGTWLVLGLILFGLRNAMVSRYMRAVQAGGQTPSVETSRLTVNPLASLRTDLYIGRALRTRTSSVELERLRRRALLAERILPLAALCMIFPSAFVSSLFKDPGLDLFGGSADPAPVLLALAAITSLGLIRAGTYWRFFGVLGLVVVVARAVASI